MLRGVIWNLFLAAIPVVAGYILAWGLARCGKRRNLLLVVCVPQGLTEWRHLLFDERWKDLLDSGRADRGEIMRWWTSGLMVWRNACDDTASCRQASSPDHFSG